MLHQHSFEVTTSGRGTYDITDEVQRVVADGGDVARGPLSHLHSSHQCVIDAV